MKQKKEASIGIALIPVFVLIGTLFYAMMVNNVWKTGWIDVQIPLIFSAFVAGIISIFVLNYSWQELQEGIVDLLKTAMGSVLIIMVIGMLIGTWLLSGIVPTMIYYGLKVLTPSIFLVVSLILCSIVSIASGSSWITAGTIGIALMGIGQGLGIPQPMIAGCIISGAYFGDKMSPLSDTTNLAAGVTGVNLFDHVRHMIYTTGPSYIITLIIFGILGMRYADGKIDPTEVNEMLTAIEGSFTISPILLIVPVFVIIMVILKIPAIPGLFLGTMLGAIFALIFQGSDVLSIVDSMHYGVSFETGNDIVNELVSGGGLDGMMWTISLLFCSMTYAGIMEKTDMLGTIASAILKLVNRVGDLIVATLLTSITINFVTGDQYLSIVIPGRMYKDEYTRRGLKAENLSRSLEDAGTIISPLIPWNSCGAYMISTLGLTPWTYVPYCILNIVTPIVAAVWGYTGFSIKKTDLSREKPA